MLWSQQPRGSAARQGPGWAPISWSATWICYLRAIRMAGVSKWWQAVCRYSWQLTPRWCPLLVVMAFHILGASERMEYRGGGRRGLSPGSLASSAELESWCEETQAFLRQLAKAKARPEAVPQQVRAREAWVMRWMAILACSNSRKRGLVAGVMVPLHPQQNRYVGDVAFVSCGVFGTVVT